MTDSLKQSRTSPEQWKGVDGTTNIGVSAKFGITSAITFDGTVNPDFSQVESNAFQIQVNQRYPEFEGKRKLFNIVRATYSLGPSRSYLGAIATDSEFAGGYNRVAGGDVSLRFGSQQVTATVLQSASADPGTSGESRSGAMAQATYSYNSRRAGFATQVEHYDEHFQMDTAFYNRTGITGGWAYGGGNFYPDKDRAGWLKKINPLVFCQYVHDRVPGAGSYLTTNRGLFVKESYLDRF